jgi:hypothetical protein
MPKFLIYFINLFTSALHVSGFLLAHLQRQVYNFGSGSSLIGMVSAPYPIKKLCIKLVIIQFNCNTFMHRYQGILIHLKTTTLSLFT